MAELYNQILAPIVTHCIIDEAGLVPENQLLSIVASLPKPQQLFLTGDRFQPPAYHLGVPDSILPRGFESILDVISRRQTIPEFELAHSYRAHPELTQYLLQTYTQARLSQQLQRMAATTSLHLFFHSSSFRYLCPSSSDHCTFTKSRRNDQ